TAPENTPQLRQDAQLKFTVLSQNPAVDQRKLTVNMMKDLGIKHPEAYLAPPEPQIPAGALQQAASQGPQGLAQLLQTTGIQPAVNGQPTQGQQPQPANGKGP